MRAASHCKRRDSVSGGQERTARAWSWSYSSIGLTINVERFSCCGQNHANYKSELHDLSEPQRASYTRNNVTGVTFPCLHKRRGQNEGSRSSPGDNSKRVELCLVLYTAPIQGAPLRRNTATKTSCWSGGKLWNEFQGSLKKGAEEKASRAHHKRQNAATALQTPGLRGTRRCLRRPPIRQAA